MNEAVLVSIQPGWIELIACGAKTVELRKSRPTIDTPFTCYIYQTRMKWLFELLKYRKLEGLTESLAGALGMVVGEFTCDRIEEIAVAFDGGSGPLKAIGGNEVWNQGMVEHYTCISTEEICRYIGGIGGVGYGWHISNLVIYERPLALSAFQNRNGQPMTRAPQSWCYVKKA